MNNNHKTPKNQDKQLQNLTERYGVVPPQAKQIEQWVLGICLIEPGVAEKTVDLIGSKVFYIPAHQTIFAVIEKLVAKNTYVDTVIVADQLTKAGELDAIGGAWYLIELSKSVVHSAGLSDWCKALIEKYLYREVIKLSNNVIQNAYNQDVDVFNLIESVGNAYMFLMESVLRTGSKTWGTVTFQRLQEMLKGPLKEGITGVPTGFIDLDKNTSGWQETDLVILAARPSMGKSALAAQMAYRPAAVNGIPTAFISLEMSSSQIVDRLISADTRIPQAFVKRNRLEDDDLKIITKHVQDTSNIPFWFNDNIFGLNEISTEIRWLVKTHGVKLVVIDYLQLIQVASEKGRNRDQDLGVITAALKRLAKSLKITIICLSQISRKAEDSANKRPMLAHLRESGNIEQDADIVMFLYREAYYMERENQDQPIDPFILHSADLIIAKARNGPLDTIKLKFLGHFVGFYDLYDDYIPYENVPRGNNPWQNNNNQTTTHATGDTDTPF